MRSINALRPLILLASFGSVFLASCKRDLDVTPSTTTSVTSTTSTVTTQDVNTWVLDSMRFYYYWNDKIPANPDKSLPTGGNGGFFDSLLNKYNATTNRDGDRFSWIAQSAADLSASLGGQSKTEGFEFRLGYRSSAQTEIIGGVIYVLPGSAADKAGIKRGDIFYKVNGSRMVLSNYQSLLSASGDTKTYTFATISNGALVDSEIAKSVTATVFQEDPVLFDSTYTIGTKKIGYLVYNQFIPGVYDQTTRLTDNTFDNKVDAVFGKFKARGVNELVLDLRYNPGGSIASAVNMASLISPNASPSTFFAKYEFNKNLMAGYQGQSDRKFVSKANNIGGSLQRLFVLTGRGTASASELIINGLKPFMNVVIIGDTTVGKNVGSITIYDRTNRIQWGMQPIVLKVLNAQGRSDYTSGFAPNVVKYEPLNPLPFGDTRETLLNEAMYQITGSRSGRRAATADVATQQPIFTSTSLKAGGSNMFVDDKTILPVKRR
jgi:C-terminal processing protease CtpA/Prc